MGNEELRAEGNRLLAEGLPSELVAAAAGMHEIYTTLREGGFTERQALWIVGYVLSGGSNTSEEREP